MKVADEAIEGEASSIRESKGLDLLGSAGGSESSIKLMPDGAAATLIELGSKWDICPERTSLTCLMVARAGPRVWFESADVLTVVSMS